MINLNKRNKIILGAVVGVMVLCCCGAAFGNESTESQIAPALVIPTTASTTPEVSPSPTISTKPTKAVVKASSKPSPKPNKTTKKVVKPKVKEVFYKNCTDARNAGAAPLFKGQPGYRPKLDRNSDGIACE